MRNVSQYCMVNCIAALVQSQCRQNSQHIDP